MIWPIVTLEKLARPEKGSIKIGPFGSQLKKTELVDQGIHVLGIENVLNKKFDDLGDRYITPEKFQTLKSAQVQPGDMLITMMGKIGEVAVVPEGIATSIPDSHLLRFRANTNLCISEYVAYLIKWGQTTRSATHGEAHGAIMKGLNPSIVKSLPAPLPPVTEQRRIVEILDQADALRKQRAEADVKSARIPSVLFYKMFGDPVTNPKGWPVEPLGQLCLGRPQYGANSKAVEYKEGMPRYIRVTDINERGQLMGDNLKSPDSTGWEQYQLVEGDLLFARSGAPAGKSYLYREQDGLCVFAGDLIRFQLDRNNMNPWVAFAYTQTLHYKNWAVSKQRTAIRPYINGQEYTSLPIMQPESELQQQFADRMERILEINRENTVGSKKIENLFELLLHQAFSGELTAKWRDAHMKELLQEIEHQAKALG